MVTLKQLVAFSCEEKSDRGETIYLSPVLANVFPEILSSCNAKPCEAPVNELLSVFTSWNDDEAAWEILGNFKHSPQD